METVVLTRATWEVRWVRNRRVVVVDLKGDFAEALRIYTKAVKAGLSDATLRSKNVGFPPPQKLRPYIYKRTKNSDGVRIVPLYHYNLHGWWWCPFCIHLRKFVHRNGFMYAGQWVPEPGYHCQMCGISHRDGHVAKWNPHAVRHQTDGVRAVHTRKKKT